MRFWDKQDPHLAIRHGIEKYYPRLWRYCLVLTGSKPQADDLAQAACLRALEQAAKFHPGTNLGRWMFRLTQRLWIDELRKQAIRDGKGLSSFSEHELIDPNPGPETNAMNQDVLVSVMKLPEAQRAAIVLVYVEGYSYRDAAMVLDIPVGTIMSRLAVARKKLVQQFNEISEAG